MDRDVRCRGLVGRQGGLERDVLGMMVPVRGANPEMRAHHQARAANQPRKGPLLRRALLRS